MFIDLIDDPHWKFGVYMAGVGRMCDYTNFDFVKHRMKNKKAIEMAYQSFGVLNMFSPFRANGAYLLKLDVFEEKQVLKMLFELCKGEGWANMKDVKLNGKPVDAVNSEFVQNLPPTGIFEGTYICPPEKEREELRMKLGVKFLNW